LEAVVNKTVQQGHHAEQEDMHAAIGELDAVMRAVNVDLPQSEQQQDDGRHIHALLADAEVGAEVTVSLFLRILICFVESRPVKASSNRDSVLKKVFLLILSQRLHCSDYNELLLY